MYGLDQEVRSSHNKENYGYDSLSLFCNFCFQLLDLVAKPVKAVILLFPIRGKLEELRKQEEAKLKEEGRVPVDPTVLWIKQTVRFRWCRSTNIVIMTKSDQQRMRNDRPSTCLDKRKDWPDTIYCRLIHHDIYRRSQNSYLSPKVQSQISSTPV